MRISAAFLIAMLLLAGGCSSPAYYWYDPGRTLEEAKADYMDSLDQARQKSGDVINDQHYDRLLPPDDPSASTGSPQDQSRTAADPRETQKAWRERYEQSVIADCMRDKGYLTIRSDRIPHGLHTKKVPEGGVAGR
ncbi:MAG: hypothetical protein NTZ17_14515 [Phycisphaerae bacterium]|nr:hypothetical protein [Phycisphaerae bacterium]